jgi:hypothetical protein|tara:strand:- start:107 stop:292 length:186 start_codon:yes stop_codon:yes gene_type:complete
MFSFITNLFKSKPKTIRKTNLVMMTKKELENLGRKHGIELDRRFTKSDLVEELYEHLKKKQ